MTPAFPERSPRWRRYLRFWHRDIHADTDDELRMHFESRVDDLVARGLSRDEARARAVEEFGDVNDVRRELHAIDSHIDRNLSRRDVLGAVRDDLRYTLRSLARSRGFVLMVVTTMALGLGLNAAMFTFIDEVFFRPPTGVADPGSVKRVWVTNFNMADHRPNARNYTNYPEFSTLARAAAPELDLALYSLNTSAHIGEPNAGRTAVVAHTTTNYLRVLGARVQRGRWFTEAENEFGSGAPVSIVSDRFAQRNDLDVGSRFVVDGVTVTVIGVAAPGFTGPDLDGVDVWLPLALTSARGENGKPWWQLTSWYGMMMIGREAPGAIDRAVAARLQTTLHAADRSLENGDSLETVSLGPINQARGPGDRPASVDVAIRLGVVAVLVLIIACANVINLLLARAVTRRRELAIRLALGVSQTRLVRLMTTESIVLALLAGSAAVLAAYWGGTLLRSLMLPGTHWATSTLSWRVVAFTGAASIVAGLVIGAVPSLRASRPNLNDLLRGGGENGSPRRSRLRGTLIGVQCALALSLLAFSLLFVASLRNVEDLDIGYDAARLVFVHAQFAQSNRALARANDQTYRALARELANLPGVEDVALTSNPPMRAWSYTVPYIGGRELDKIVTDWNVFPSFSAVGPSYFRTVGTRLVRGSTFLPNDARHTVVINEEMARLIWPSRDPIGQCMRFEKATAPCYEVIGIVRDSRRDKVTEEVDRAMYYLPIDDMPFKGWDVGTLIARVDPRAMNAFLADARERVRRDFPAGWPDVTSMRQFLDPQYRPYRIGATLFTAFGVLAFVVTVVGIYSTVAYGVQQRTREFSIRAALGATTRDVVRHIVGEELRAVLVGVLAGVAIVLAGGRFVASLLYGIQPTNAPVMAIVTVLLLLAAIAASLGPAWRAGRADPVNALKSE